jgi:hypothetical protein
MENMNFFSLLIKKVFLFSKEKLGEECLNWISPFVEKCHVCTALNSHILKFQKLCMKARERMSEKSRIKVLFSCERAIKKIWVEEFNELPMKWDFCQTRSANVMNEGFLLIIHTKRLRDSFCIPFTTKTEWATSDRFQRKRFEYERMSFWSELLETTTVALSMSIKCSHDFNNKNSP